MEQAGANKDELQKVIDHYTNDDCNPMKLKAAYFLLSNMDGCHSFTGDDYQRYLTALDSMNLPIGIHHLEQNIPLNSCSSMFPDLEPKDDLSTISSEYLINHIDYIFQLWETEPWLKDVDFDDICEFLLPYRIDKEPFIDWKKSSVILRKRLYPLMHYYDDTKYSIANLSNTVLKECHRFANYNPSNTNFKLPLIGNYKLACEEITYIDLIHYRMAGIPSAIDCVPCWGDVNGMHVWAAPVTKEKKGKSDYLISERRMPKVYRRTFSKHNNSNYDKDIKNYPFNLSDDKLIDVTDEYVKCYDVDVDFERNPQKSNKYLAVFNNRNWIPVASSSTSAFSKMGADILYLPICLKTGNGREQILSHPFILQKNGKTHYLIPDMKKSQRVVLYRKYPYESRKMSYNTSSAGTLFYGSNKADFSDCDTLYRIVDDIKMNVQRISLPKHKKYRYIKIRPSRALSLAELKLYGDNELTPAEYKSEGPYTFTNNIFDNDWLTYTVITSDLIIDLGSEQELKKIVFQGRNDGNNVEPGDRYELLYMTLDGWKSCGSKIADADSISFDNVPVDALYWLRDRSKGLEERIFTISNGEQRFW